MRLCGLWGAGRLRLLCLARKLRVGCKAPPPRNLRARSRTFAHKGRGARNSQMGTVPGLTIPGLDRVWIPKP